MSINRKDNFERSMKDLPNELVDHISNYVPEPIGNIAKYNFWSNADRDAYRGITDTRYNDLPQHYKEIINEIRLDRYGTFEQVKNTLDRWFSSEVDQDWDKFIINYPYDKCINPYAIKRFFENKKWNYIGGKRVTKMHTKKRIYKKRNTRKRRSKK